MASKAWPIACALDAHADTGAYAGPFAPKCVDTALAAALYMDHGMVVGGTRGWPALYTRRNPAASVSQPPRPVPMMTPKREGSTAPAMLACVAASSAAINAKRLNRSKPLNAP